MQNQPSGIRDNKCQPGVGRAHTIHPGGGFADAHRAMLLYQLTFQSQHIAGHNLAAETGIFYPAKQGNLSTPNAAYKINSLVKKGYVERIQSTTDKREYRLRPTQKYIDYYNISYSYLHLVMERAKQRFSPDDLAKLEEMLQIVSDELMPEIQLPK